jgi:hypothetical protein
VLDLGSNITKLALIVGKDEEVVDVANVTQSELVGDEVIERVEIEGGEEPAGLIAQGQPPPPLGGCEQVVAGKPHRRQVLRVAVVDDRAGEPEDLWVLELASDEPLEDGLIDRGKVLADVCFQYVLEAPGELLGAYVFLITVDSSVFSLISIRTRI